jgi:hypothetical protein
MAVGIVVAILVVSNVPIVVTVGARFGARGKSKEDGGCR